MHRFPRIGVLLIGSMVMVAACQPAGAPGAPGGETGSDSAGAAAVCAADEFGCVEIAEGDPLTIGGALVVTGPNADLGIDAQRGMEVAAQVRGNEILGHRIHFDIQDDGCSAEGGAAAARALASEGRVVAAIGTSCSSAAVPAAEILSGQGVLLVSPSSTAPSLTDPASHQPFFARIVHNDKIQGAAMARFACEELGAEIAATIHDGSPYAEQLQAVFVDEFASICDGETVHQEAVTVGQVDASALLTAVAAQGPDILYYPIFVAEGALITQQARQNPALADTVLAGADGLQSPSFLEAAGESAEEMYLSGPDLEFEGDFYKNEFVPAYRELSGGPPVSVFHAHAYDGLQMVFAALEEVAIQEGGITYIPRTALRDAFFATADHAGITGSLTCDEYGDCADPEIMVRQVRNGEFVRVWP